MLNGIKNRLQFAVDHTYLFIVGMVTFGAAVIGKILLPTDGYWGGIAVELGGIAWDVTLITVILGLYEARRRRLDKIENLRRQINDFKRLDDDYSKSNIGSSL